MIRPLLAASFACSIALTAPAFAQSEGAQTMMRVMEEMGCVVTEETSEAFLAAMGESSAALETAGNELLNAGLIRFEDGAIVLTAGDCAEAVAPAEPAPEGLVAMMIALRDQGCVVTEAGADALFGALGPREEVMGYLSDLDDTNFIHISRSFGGAVVSERLCEASDEVVATFASQVADMLELPERDRLDFVASRPGARVLYVEWLATQDCAVPHAASTAGMQHFGFDNTLAAVVVPLLEGGLLESDETHLTLRADLCAATPEARLAAVNALPPGDFPLD